MPKSSVNASLSSYDDIFSTEESRQEEQREQVQQIPIGELFPFKNHPFKVLDDDSMSDTVESVKQYGVLSPLIARPRPKGGYEIISGHRRQHAAELAGLETLPVIVREMSDDAAVILMVDSNLQREHILPSERAFAYKMKLDQLSVIEIKPYRERQKRTLYPPKENNRDRLCGVIDTILAEKPKDYEVFLQGLEQQGYEVKRGKYTSVKGARQKRFIRFRTLGAGYSEEELKAVISGEAEHHSRQKQKRIVPEQKFQMLVDIQAKLAEGKSIRRTNRKSASAMAGIM